MMAGRANMHNKVREVLVRRSFSEQQIESVIPKLSKEYIEQPAYLGQIVDAWNQIMGSARIDKLKLNDITKTAKPPKDSVVDQLDSGIDMNCVLSEVEPDLLRLDPERLLARHHSIQGLGIAHNLNENWVLLLNAPRGFYLQDWSELTKKILYVEHKILNLLFTKRELKEVNYHPLLKAAAAVETSFDHIRMRYLFTKRIGFKELSHLYPVQKAEDKLNVKDLLLTDDYTYLRKFSPFCTDEEYQAFKDLIKNHDIDEDDADIIEKYSELNSLRY